MKKIIDMKKTLLTVLSVLALAGATAQAAAPSLSYEVNGDELVITYTGILYKSSDAVAWAPVASASNPYKVALNDKKQFFCAKCEEDPSKNITIPLSDTVDLDMIWVEPGTFLMGSPEDELGRANDETQYEVTLTKGYWLGTSAIQDLSANESRSGSYLPNIAKGREDLMTTSPME